MVATNGNLKQLVAASSSELFALTTNDKLVVSKDGGLTWANESLDSDASYLPVTMLVMFFHQQQVMRMLVM